MPHTSNQMFNPETAGFDPGLALAYELTPQQTTSELAQPQQSQFGRRILVGAALSMAAVTGAGTQETPSSAHADTIQNFEEPTVGLQAGEVLKVTVPEAVGGQTVIGNLTSTETQADGFITAFPCGTNRPDASDLNPSTQGVRANRLIAQANSNGEVCFFTHTPTNLIVDVNGIADSDVIAGIPNQRTDTRQEAQNVVGVPPRPEWCTDKVEFCSLYEYFSNGFLFYNPRFEQTFRGYYIRRGYNSPNQELSCTIAYDYKGDGTNPIGSSQFLEVCPIVDIEPDLRLGDPADMPADFIWPPEPNN